ncbi:hypothetical protein LCGC14_2586300 [marine sediment metagenome]|uniref:Uncharacterized protein n=1 Tax=marine sediment metagenome TaxID=412755 RepID=A0A0F9CP25_9ZZZZ
MRNTQKIMSCLNALVTAIEQLKKEIQDPDTVAFGSVPQGHFFRVTEFGTVYMKSQAVESFTAYGTKCNFTKTRQVFLTTVNDFVEKLVERWEGKQ